MCDVFCCVCYWEGELYFVVFVVYLVLVLSEIDNFLFVVGVMLGCFFVRICRFDEIVILKEFVVEFVWLWSFLLRSLFVL